MKNFMIFLLALVFSLSTVTACGDNTEETQNEGGSDSDLEASDDDSATESDTDTETENAEKDDPCKDCGNGEICCDGKCTVPNECGGCAEFEFKLGDPCGADDDCLFGQWVCSGPENLRCDSDLKDTQFDDALCSMNIDKWCLDQNMIEHLTGVWVQELYLSADANVPVVNDVKSATMKYVRIEIVEKDGHLVLKDMLPCAMETHITEGDAISKTIKTYFPENFLTRFFYAGPHQLKTPLACFDISGTPDNFNFQMNRWYEMRGAHIYDEDGNFILDVETEMITSNDDPRIFDHSEDGRPGSTFEIQSSIASGFVWGVIMNFMELTVINGSGTSLSGTVDWNEISHTIDSSHYLFKAERTTTARPDESSFKMVKLDEPLSCEEIEPILEELFPEKMIP